MPKLFFNTSRERLVSAMSCLVAFLVIGTARLASLLFVVCIDRYHVSREQASVPFVVMFTVANVISPLVGYAGKKIGLRFVSASGCLLSAIGMGACFFAEDIVIVIIFYGVVFGIGFGMIANLIPEILRQTFTSDIDKANGIFLGGSSLGAMLLPALAVVFLEKYGQAGIFLMLSSVILNSVPAALLMTLQKRYKETPSIRQFTKEINTDIAKEDCETKCSLVHNHNEYAEVSQTMSELNAINGELNTREYHELVHNSNSYSILFKNNNANKLSDNSINLEVRQHANPSKLTALSPIMEDESIEAEKNGALSQKVMSQEHYGNADVLENSTLLLSVEEKNSKLPPNSFGVFLDPTFFLILLTQGLLYYIIICFYTIMVDASRDRAVSVDEEAYLLMGFSLMDMAGRFCLGYITDGGYITKTRFSALCFAVLGLLMILFSWLQGFIMAMVLVCLSGLSMGGLMVIGFGVTIEHIEEDNVTMAIASRFFAFPLFSFTQPLVIGFFREKLQSYDGLFYFLAAICFSCCVMTLLTPAAARYRDKRKKRDFTDK